jgi:hypothetical protein
VRARALVTIAAASLALSACGATATERRDLALTPVEASCHASAEGPTMAYATLPLLPEDVEPVGVIECRTNQAGDPGSGWVERRATTGIDAYVTALQQPDARLPLFGVNCTADALLIPWSAVLLADGTALRVGTPVDACGKPQRDAQAAYDALPWSDPVPVPAPSG